MRSCHLTCSLAALVFSVVISGCVPYQSYEELAFDNAVKTKALGDLRAKYNRLLQELSGSSGGASAGQIERLRRELSAKAAAISVLEDQLAGAEEIGFDPADQIPGVEHGSRGELILGDLLFRSGSADIGSNGRAALTELARLLKEKYAGETFHLIGHTDNDPIRRSVFKTNLNLGLGRASMVFTYLKQEHEFTEENFVITSHGARKPKVPNSGRENKAKNRRVEIFRVPTSF